MRCCWQLLLAMAASRSCLISPSHCSDHPFYPPSYSSHLFHHWPPIAAPPSPLSFLSFRVCPSLLWPLDAALRLLFPSLEPALLPAHSKAVGVQTSAPPAMQCGATTKELERGRQHSDCLTTALNHNSATASSRRRVFLHLVRQPSGLRVAPLLRLGSSDTGLQLRAVLVQQQGLTC